MLYNEVMKENSIVRENLMTREGYSPYCGNMFDGCKHAPRTSFNGKQFECPDCGWVSEFPQDFIDKYKLKWNK
jgi:hypothetical protein